jgi:hypothetical protein
MKNMTNIKNKNFSSFAFIWFCIVRNDNTFTVRFQVLTAVSMKMTVFGMLRHVVIVRIIET